MKTCSACQKTYPDETTFCLLDGTRLADPLTQADAQLAAGLSRHYRVVRRLGKGGMGTVFLAEQIMVGNRLVAVKVVNRKFLEDPDFLRRFENEAGSTGRIHHPNVVSIYESAQADDGTPYIAMEFLEGESLREVLLQRGALPAQEVAEILQQSARGLNAAHKLGIIHRDLKPDNIFLTHGEEGELVVKVVDFGIAKLRESAVMHTQTGMVLGTPAYMSSEQAYGMRSDELDARSDIYSLGVVVYEMLTGNLPFHSDTPAGFLRKHMLDEPPPFRAISPGLGVPPQVEAVVMKALKKKREERYSSALEFAQAFVAALPAIAPEVNQELPSTQVFVPPPAPASMTNAAEERPSSEVFVPPPTPGSKMKVIAMAGIVLILILTGVWYFSRQGVRKDEVSPSAQGAPSESNPSKKVEAPGSQEAERLIPNQPSPSPAPAPPSSPTPVQPNIAPAPQRPRAAPIMVGKVDVSHLAGLHRGDTREYVASIFGLPTGDPAQDSSAFGGYPYTSSGGLSIRVSFTQSDGLAQIKVYSKGSGGAGDPLLNLLGKSESDAIALLGPPKERESLYTVDESDLYWLFPEDGKPAPAYANNASEQTLHLYFRAGVGCEAVAIVW
jgi:serine/threonine-protein kinase